MISTLAIHGYRSLRDVVLELGRVTVVSGANGSGKSSLYRALQLLGETASGTMISSLARSGGLSSVLWAGPEHISGAMKRGEAPIQGTGSRKAPVGLMLGFATDDLGYLIDVGLPTPDSSRAFQKDPVIKREAIFVPPVLRPAATLVRRKNGEVAVHEGRSWEPLTGGLDQRRSMLGEIGDLVRCPEVFQVRQLVRRMRFYDGFRVDASSPVRQPQVGTWTPVLSSDGSDLAPAVATILASAWAGPFQEAIDAAFPGSRVIVGTDDARWQLFLQQPGMLRALAADELSDGTLRFVLLAAALLSPEPPSLLVLNEPESSLHPELLPAVAELIRLASERTQVLVVTHSAVITAALAACEGTVQHHLAKEFGETVLPGRGMFERPQWDWGSR